MGSKCTRDLVNNVRDELWSYFALSGLLFLHIGIVLMVFALKRASPYPVVLETFGVGLIVLGVLATLTSWYVHRQQRQKKELFVCATCCYHCPRAEAALGSFKPGKNSDSSASSSPGDERKPKPGSTSTIKMFIAPEFQRYAEFIKRETVGVEVNGSRAASQKSRVQHVHTTPQVALSSNASVVKLTQ